MEEGVKITLHPTPASSPSQKKVEEELPEEEFLKITLPPEKDRGTRKF